VLDVGRRGKKRWKGKSRRLCLTAKRSKTDPQSRHKKTEAARLDWEKGGSENVTKGKKRETGNDVTKKPKKQTHEAPEKDRGKRNFGKGSKKFLLGLCHARKEKTKANKEA